LWLKQLGWNFKVFSLECHSHSLEISVGAEELWHRACEVVAMNFQSFEVSEALPAGRHASGKLVEPNSPAEIKTAALQGVEFDLDLLLCAYYASVMCVQ
jgi:hypothetical protein